MPHFSYIYIFEVSNALKKKNTAVQCKSVLHGWICISNYCVCGLCQKCSHLGDWLFLHRIIEGHDIYGGTPCYIGRWKLLPRIRVPLYHEQTRHISGFFLFEQEKDDKGI